MSWLKRFWITFFSFLPFSAGAVAPWIVGGIAGVGAIAGFSIYRSYVPVDMNDSLNFFSSCWSCQMFSDVMATMSGLLPRAYNAIGLVTIPVAVALMAVWVAWKLIAGYTGMAGAKPIEGWSLAGTFGTKLIKLSFVLAFLVFPLPRLISNVIVEPVFNVGFTLGRAINTDFQAGTAGENQFETCLVATAIADPAAANGAAARAGAFSPKLRHNLTCQLAGIHQMTALGMTTGWTMLNMAFSDDYMHKIMWDVPIFPNVPILLAGALLVMLFFYALLPVPLYLLKVFIDLSMDLIMLPLFLLSWLFDDWGFLKSNSLTATINNLIKNVCGIAMIGVFISFGIIFMNAIFSGFDGLNILFTAFKTNDPALLMDGLLMNNDSLISLILMGLFLAMFMSMIEPLIKTLFATVGIPDDYYKKAGNDLKSLYSSIKKWMKPDDKK